MHGMGGAQCGDGSKGPSLPKIFFFPFLSFSNVFFLEGLSRYFDRNMGSWFRILIFSKT